MRLHERALGGARALSAAAADVRAEGASRVEFELDPAGVAPVDAIACDAFDELIVTLHSHEARVHDAIARARGGFERTMALLQTMQAFPSVVRVRVPLWGRAAQDVRALVARVVSAASRPVIFDASVPADRAEGPGADALVTPGWDALRSRIGNLAAAAEAAGCRLEVRPGSGVPVCALPAAYRGVAGARGNADGPSYPPCEACEARSGCTGPRDWYVALYGAGGLRGVSGELDGLPSGPGEPAIAGVRWGRWEAELAAARDALVAGDVPAARERMWEALGFAGPPPEGEGGAAAFDPGRDLALIVEQAIARLGCSRAEEVAYLAGVKPVLYLTVPFDRLDATLERFEGHRIAVVDPRTGGRVARGVSTAHAHVFVSRHADGPSACERIYRAGDPTRQAAEMGRWMGYPPCCAEAFARSRDNSSDSGNVYAAAARTAGGGHPLLNLGAVYLVPFYPCSFDCDAAAGFAAAVFDALFPASGFPEQRADVLRRTSRPTLYFDNGLSVFFEGVRAGSDVRYDGIEFGCRTPDPTLDYRLMSLTLGPALTSGRQLSVGDARWIVEGGPARSELPRRPDSPGILLPFTSRSSATDPR